MKNRLAIVGLIIIIVLMLSAVFAPFLAPYDPNAIDLAGSLESPNSAHWLGQDRLGRDIFSRIIWGTRVSLIVGIVTIGISLVAGIIMGSLAGYFGGIVDEVIMRIIDILLSFPGILLAIALAGVLGPSLQNIVLALALLSWVGFARMIRAQFLSVREREFVLAAIATGVSGFRVIFKHILPNIMAPVIVQATFGMAGVILAEASLSFLGLGIQDQPSWGGMLNEGVDYLLFAPHLATYPGIAIMLTVLGFNFLGEGLRDRWDPKHLTKIG